MLMIGTLKICKNHYMIFRQYTISSWIAVVLENTIDGPGDDADPDLLSSHQQVSSYGNIPQRHDLLSLYLLCSP